MCNAATWLEHVCVHGDKHVVGCAWSMCVCMGTGVCNVVMCAELVCVLGDTFVQCGKVPGACVCVHEDMCAMWRRA